MKVIYNPKNNLFPTNYYFKQNKIYTAYLKEEYYGIKNYYIVDDTNYEWRFVNIEKEFEKLNNIRKEKLRKLNQTR